MKLHSGLMTARHPVGAGIAPGERSGCQFAAVVFSHPGGMWRGRHGVALQKPIF